MTDPSSDGGIKVLSEEEVNAAIRSTGLPLQVSTWAVGSTVQREQQRMGILVLTPEPDRRSFVQTSLWDQHDLVQMAREILQHFAPTPEQEILETLKRIESRLPESG